VRNYPIDSPEAAARLVALALMADGNVDRSELLLLERQQLLNRLGLDQEQFDSIYYDYCTDMLGSAYRHATGELELDAGNIKKILSEIQDPGLQKKLLRMMLDIVNADHRLTGNEATLISHALRHWEIDLYVFTESSVPRHRSHCGTQTRVPSG
jgi:uncharacterized tellurite resistance protein B-like protein